MNQQQTTHRLLMAIDKIIDLTPEQANIVEQHLKYAYTAGYESLRSDLLSGRLDERNKPVRKYISDKPLKTYLSIKQAADSIDEDSQTVINAIRKNDKVKGFWFEYA